ncbi:hypothetical protein [Thiolapillus sp.]
MKKINFKLAGVITILIGQLGVLPFSFGGEREADLIATVQMEQTFNSIIENRDLMITEIIEDLRASAEKAGYAASWKMEMTAALEDASDEALLAAYNAHDYASVIRAILGKNFDKGALVAAYEANDASSLANEGSDRQATIAAAIPTTHDFVYKPITPCRIVDTRIAGGAISAGISRGFYAHGNTTGQGGTVCNDPPIDARGYMLNVTVTQPTTSGHIRIYPEGAALPNASIVNFSAGQTIANGIITEGAYNVGYDFRIYAAAQTHVVVDLMGYFNPPSTGPGIEFSSAGQHSWSGIAQCTSYTDLTQVTVSAPTSGYILVQASGTSKNTTGGGTYWRVCLDDASGGNTCDGYSWIIEPPSTTNFKNEKSWSLQNVYIVGAGNKTIYLKACHSEFAGGDIMWNRVVATFFPTRY